MKDLDGDIEDILNGCMKNSRVSQKLLYQRFYAYGMSICLRYSGDREEAVEILNDGFMKVFKNLDKFELGKPFKPWLRRILINTAINAYHQKQRQVQTDEIDEARYQTDTETILPDISYQEIISLLQHLPPAYRTAFNLYVIEGYKHEEIAEMLNTTVGTSKSNLFKAKQQLQKLLASMYKEEDV